jgi:hypothetical protein
MRKTKSLQISIPEPCTQNWNDMQQNEQGRFCTHCQKTVIDFSRYSDAALYAFVSKNNGQVCGRFRVHQLNRRISVPPQPHSNLYRMFIGLGMTLLFVPVSQDVKAQSYTPVKEERSYIVSPENKAKPGKNTVQLKGRISLDGINPNVILGADGSVFGYVSIMQDDQTIAEIATDNDGYYGVYLHPCTYEITVNVDGYIGVERKKITVTQNTNLDFTLKVDPDYQLVMGGMRRFENEFAEDNCSVKAKRK